MPNYDGRHELRFFYTTTLNSRALTHRHTIDFDGSPYNSVDPPRDFASTTVTTHGDDDVSLASMVDDYVALLLPFWRPTTEFARCEWWRYGAEPSEDAVFMGVHDILEPGTAASGVDIEAQQATITYRLVGGGVMRQQLMEVFVAGNGYQTFPTAVAIVNNLSAYIRGTSHCFLGRDNTRPIATIGLGLGQNERLWRKRFRE